MRILILPLIVLAISAYIFWGFYDKYQKAEVVHNEARKEKDRMQIICEQSERLINDLKTKPYAVERIAREKFGWCKEGEEVYSFESQPAVTDTK